MAPPHTPSSRVGEGGRQAGRKGGRKGTYVAACLPAWGLMPPSTVHPHAACLPPTGAGVAHGAFDNELEALAGLRDLLSFLPQSNRDKLRRVGG